MGGLLIVDDQEVVRQGIRKMIDEFELPLGTIREASDGREALRASLEEEPDIVLVDIMMPGMDGLEFVRELKAKGAKSHVVIVSAHSEFDFAQQAIALKVDRYILKPVTRKELYQTLSSAIGHIRSDNEKSERLEEQQRKYMDLLLYEYLNRRDMFVNADELYRGAGIAGLPGPWFQIALVRSKDDSSPIGSGLTAEAERLRDDRALTFQPTEHLSIVVRGFSDPEDGWTADSLRDLGRTSAERYRIGISGSRSGTDALPELYRQADAALSESRFRNVPACHYEAVRSEDDSPVKLGTYQSFVEAFRTGGARELTRHIDDLFYLLGKSDLGFEEVRSLLSGLVRFVHLNLKDAYSELKISDRFKNDFSSSAEFFALKAAFKQETERMFAFVEELRAAQTVSPVIRAVLVHIARNYGKELSLTVIANEHNVNYNYLSTLFAKVVGVPFTDYVLKFRLEKALELLQTGRYKVLEVAEMTGFNDAKYFGKAFRKTYGTTPASRIPKL